MTILITIRRISTGAVCLSLIFSATVLCSAQDRDDLESYVYRVGRQAAADNQEAADVRVASIERDLAPKSQPLRRATAHPLDVALDKARESLDLIRRQINDYTCVVVKQGTINGELKPREYFEAKIRNRKVQNDQVVVPFSVYVKFLKPASVKGREVVFVEGQNNNKMMAHEGGGFLKDKFPSVWLDPDGMIAMRGNKYPITELGLENLCVRLLQRVPLEIDRATCKVEIIKGAKLNGRVCTCTRVTHPQAVPGIEAQELLVFYDDQFNVPVHFAAYGFPTRGASQGQVLESYTYLDLKLNVGLKDVDFDPKNPNYNFF